MRFGGSGGPSGAGVNTNPNVNANTNTTAADHLARHPWTQPAWARVSEHPQRLHHGLLITGVPGVAKREFAMALGQLLLCDGGTGGGRPCGGCRNCTLFQAGTHPDFHVLATELEWRDGRIELINRYCDRYHDLSAREKRANPGRVIPVDQVRLLSERFSSHAHIATRKIALLVPADQMNTNAANALLKLLEEPPGDSMLMLVSATPGYLPATIRSRCLQINIPPPTAKAGAAWLGEHLPAADAARALGLAHGGPVNALRLYNDGFLQSQDQFQRGVAELANGKISALELAARLKPHDFPQVLDWLHRFNCDLIKEFCGVATVREPTRLNPGPGRLSAEKLFTLYDHIGYYRKIAREQLNEQLALEELILGLQGVLESNGDGLRR